MESVVVDSASAAKYQANLETARNGVPIINIVKPDTSGLSHNKFLNYNVEKQGLILNNSNQLQVTTQLGGVIYGNTNLANANSADRILNEVTGLNKSILAGYTEVAGSMASVIVANPNGIFVKGGGFINTPKVTLTTGVPQFTANQLKSYKITQGIIEIGDENFNIDNVDKIDLYAKALKFNSKLYAKDVNIITGTNDISTDGTITPITMTNNDIFSLDSTALGGIYADKIRLVGTSEGVGVNLPAEIMAKDNIIISLDGQLTFKRVLSNGNINIKSNTINAVNATAESYKDLSIYASDILVSNTNLSSSGNVYISANDFLEIKSDSKLTAKNNLSIFAHNQNLELSGVLLSSDNLMNIETKSLINNTDLQANGDLSVKTINGDLVNNKLLQSQKNLTLNINGDIVNTAAIVSLNDMKVYATDLLNYNTIYSSQNMNIHVDNLLLNKTDTTKVSGIDNARLYAVENMLLSKDESLHNINEVQNYKGIIQTQKGNIAIFADTLKNITDTTEKTVEIQSIELAYNKIALSEYMRESIHTYINKNEKFSIAPDKFSSIASANNLSIYSNHLLNYLGDVSAQNDMSLAVTNISNESEKLYSTKTTEIQIYNCYSACYSSKHSNPSFRWENYGSPTTVVTGEVGSLDATISAGNNIIGDITNLENVTAHTAVTQNDIFTDIITAKNSTRYIDKEDYITPTNPYGLFVKSTKHEYLIESNPLYTDISNFIGSEYFLNKMGYNGDAISKRLGDAMYETKLVKDSLKRLGGKVHKETTYISLMDNAVEVSQNVDLKLGKAPTDEQLASIDKDIVWMETKIVNGEEVLVPVVYLAKSSKTSSGSVISAGNEFELNVKNSIVNSGELTAEGNLNISAKSIKNEQGVISSNKDTTVNSETSIENIASLITAAGATNIKAKEDITNSNGSTISGKRVNIESTDASVINETSTETTVVKNDANGNRYEVISTKVGGESKIVSSDGDIFIKAKDNIKNSAANISATNGNINLLTENGDIELSSKELVDKADFSAGRSFTKTDNTKHIASQLNADSISLQSGSDIQVKASSITAKDSIVLNANREIDILAANNIDYKDVQTYKKGNFGSSKSKRDMTYKESVVQSNLNAKSILINSDKDVTLEAAKLKADENIIVDAKGNINVVAKEYKEGELHQTSKSSWGGLKKSVSMDRLDNLNLKEAQLQTEALNVILKSGKDINIIASDISSAADVQLEAFDKLLIAAGEELRQKESFSKKTSFNPLGVLNLVGIDAGAIYTSEINKNKNYDTKIKESNIVAGNNFTADTGSTKVIGSNIEAQNDINIKSDINSVEILSAQEQNQASKLNQKVEVKLTNIVDMAKSALAQQVDVLKNSTDKDSAGGSKLKINVASATYDKDEVSSNAVKNISSNLVSNSGSISVDSSEDIHVKGSNLNAKDSIALVAKTGDVSIEEAVDTKNVDEKNKHAGAEVSITVQNEYVEIASAVKAAAASAKQLKKVKEDYSNHKTEVKKLEGALSQLKQDLRNKEVGVDAQDIEEIQEILDNAKDDERYYLAAIAAATADLTSKTAAIAKQAATAAASSATFGFSAGLSLDLEGSKTTSNNQATQSVASNLVANNINIQTDKSIDTNVKVSGSNVIAQDTINIETKNLSVKASEDTTNSTSDTKEISGSVSMTMYGAASGTSVSLGYGEQHSDAHSVAYNNSQLQANNININTSNDAAFEGANVNAKDTLNLTVGNNLNIESKRNVTNSNSNGFNVSAGFGTSEGSVTSANASVGANTGRVKVKQTVLSSVTGDKVTVTTENNTNLKGSLLAAGEFDKNGNFIDNEDLNLKTKTLTFSNSTDSTYTSGNSFNVGTNIGFSSDVKDPQPKDDSTTKINSTNLAFSNSLGYQRNKTLATLGKGNIDIQDKENSDDTTSLNRDTSNISKTMINTNYGVKVDATLDHRLLTEDGREEIKQEYEDIGKNMAIVGKTLPNAESDNPIESTIGTIWDWIAHGTLDILPSNENSGGVLGNVPIWFGTNDNLHKLQGDENSKDVYLNGILNSEADAMQGGKNIIGEDKTYVNPYNPTRGILGDLIEAGVDKWGDSIGMQTGISKQVQEYLNNNTDLNVYMHSQGNLVTKQGALSSKDNGHVYKSYGAPMSNEEISKIFIIKDKEKDIRKNDGDYVSYPLNIFNPTTWNKLGHGTENYKAQE
ncbi:MAG: hemagglutinin repeat-containing protein [Sulfurimonas sp.]|uniref:two-partner secretion domain-containing protein n=1 Tax=Sulfurimonas sp. TaxID=2022749 RepID=UPI00262540F7|nr:hemagglutinin repeat-containing protein [Sulfurimonas sp.]MDD2651904.1 hemagglutinin repeat-containing protein [Sulfurimonas sp.]MDD3451779.1 hemagglutinin repeat-containing protein [Sulfurimonas sp.]